MGEQTTPQTLTLIKRCRICATCSPWVRDGDFSRSVKSRRIVVSSVEEWLVEPDVEHFVHGRIDVRFQECRRPFQDVSVEVVGVVHSSLREPTKGLRDGVDDVVRAPIERRANKFTASAHTVNYHVQSLHNLGLTDKGN